MIPIYRPHSKKPLFLIINIIGLSVAFAAVILIGLYVWHEYSYDRWLPNSDRIYRINGVWTKDSGEVEEIPITVPALVPAAKKSIPGIENIIRISGSEGGETYECDGEKHLLKWSAMVDSSFFDVIKLKFLSGSPENAFRLPHPMVLTESTARKMFGDDDPIGKRIDTGMDTASVVTAVVEDIRETSHFGQFSLIYP